MPSTLYNSGSGKVYSSLSTTTTETTTPNGPVTQDFRYTYDAVGNIVIPSPINLSTPSP